MLSTDLVATSVGAEVGAPAARLIVTRRGADDGAYRAIGYLDRVADTEGSAVYEFKYLATALVDPTFVPIVGFKDLQRHYQSTRLFPSFADRVISAKRPDRPQYLAALDLSDDADAWEILTASGGHREGDPIELISLPTYDERSGQTSACFLAHGVRYRSLEASEYISALAPGARLTLEPDSDNPVNGRAIRVVDGHQHLGFVPDPLLDYVHSVLASGNYELTVVRANPAATHPHLRLLLRLSGHCEEFVFNQQAWRTT